ncbi:MAG: hypothetical protein ACXW3Z_14040 [Limisphaerales bacterium]
MRLQSEVITDVLIQSGECNVELMTVAGPSINDIIQQLQQLR